MDDPRDIIPRNDLLCLSFTSSHLTFFFFLALHTPRAPTRIGSPSRGGSQYAGESRALYTTEFRLFEIGTSSLPGKYRHAFRPLPVVSLVLSILL